MKRIVILISGRGSNMEAIINAEIPNSEVVAVISNRAEAEGLEIARSKGITALHLSHSDFESREKFDRNLAELVSNFRPDLVVLAGFMRVLTSEFISRFPNKIINIHPSLLPSFKGLNTHRRAIEAGCKYGGCSVHFVVPELDSGPIIDQIAVRIKKGEKAESLAKRVLNKEHSLIVRCLRKILN